MCLQRIKCGKVSETIIEGAAKSTRNFYTKKDKQRRNEFSFAKNENKNKKP